MRCRLLRRGLRPRNPKLSSRRFEGTNMKLKFDPSLQYQQDAVSAVVGAFEGQPFVQTGAMAFQSLQIGGLFQTELGLGNRISISDEDILANVRAVQEANEIEKVAALDGREFSVEMETGTG